MPCDTCALLCAEAERQGVLHDGGGWLSRDGDHWARWSPEQFTEHERMMMGAGPRTSSELQDLYRRRADQDAAPEPAEPGHPRVLTEAEQWELVAAEVALTEAARKVQRADEVLRAAGYKVNLRPAVLGGYLQRFRRRVDDAVRQSKALNHRQVLAAMRDHQAQVGQWLDSVEAGL